MAKAKAKRAGSKRPTRLRDDPATTMPELCRRGQHPVSRKLGRGCGACGDPTAWAR